MHKIFVVGEIPYLNCLPFFWRKEGAETLEFLQAPPKKLGELARSGKILAAPFSLIDSLLIAPLFTPLADLGIVAKTAARSVILFSKKPILSLNHQPVGITSETATSSELLRLICHKRYFVHPEYRMGFSENDTARLLIGDGAIRELELNHKKEHWPYIFDLGQEWFDWQKSSFVFARWMIRKDANAATKELLAAVLSQNVADFAESPAALRFLADCRSVLNPNDLKDYLSSFRYVLTEADRQTIQKFDQLRIVTEPASV